MEEDIQTVTKRELGGCTNIRQDRLEIKSIMIQ